jgi:hypothetical protein
MIMYFLPLIVVGTLALVLALRILLPPPNGCEL